MPGITGCIALDRNCILPPDTLSCLLSPLLHEDDYKVHRFTDSAQHVAAIVDPGIDEFLCGVWCDPQSSVSVGFYGEFYDSELCVAQNGTQTAAILVDQYLKLGEKLPESLDGSYVVLVADPRADKFMLFNDYCGSRPLFYGVQNDILYFSPEAKGVAGAPGFDASVDIDAQVAMLACSSPIADHSFFRNVKPLFPGKVLTIQGSKLHKSDSRRYLPSGEATDHGEKYYLNVLCDLLLEAARKLLRDPDHIVIPLSGGIDSRMIAGCVHKLTGGQLRTVSWGVSEGLPGSDTLTAQLVAGYLKSDHHFVRRQAEHIQRDMPEMLYRVDGLITDPVSHSNELNIMRRLREEFGGRYVLRGEECFGHASTPGCDAEALWSVGHLTSVGFPAARRDSQQDQPSGTAQEQRKALSMAHPQLSV